MLDLRAYEYLSPPPRTGDTEADALAFLRENGRPKIAAHVLEVADTAVALARRFGLNPAVARTAAILHDISGVMKPADMMACALAHGWYIDESEQRYPFILHQRMSRVLAREVFGIHDETVLSMVACHTTLKDGATDDDILLFLADKLAWDQPGTPPYFDPVSQALDTSLAFAAGVYMRYVLAHGMILLPHRWFLEAKAYVEASHDDR